MAINSINNGIGRQTHHISDAQQTHRNADAKPGIPQQPATNSGSDTVQLTGTASQLRSLEQQIAALPVVDVQRVDTIKKEIASGTYDIDPPRVADKMIQIESAINQRLI